MKRFIFPVLLTFIYATSVLAVPAKPGPRIVSGSDGTDITVYAHGDEFYHWLTDKDGNLVKEQPDGTYAVSGQKMTDELLSSRMLMNRRARVADGKRRVAAAANQAQPLNIAPRGLIILVGYSDKSFSTDRAEIDSMINGLNYSRSYTYRDDYDYTTVNVTASGSARQYFIDQSMGDYKPHFDIAGPYTLSKQLSYYGRNSSNGDDANADKLIIEACEKADADGIDFSLYDNNKDGEIDFVFVIYAGYGEADGGASNTIWPHAFWIYDGYGITKNFDGKRLNTYACSNEINYSSNKHNGIGTFCHEFSHVLGLPDLYVTQSSSEHKTMGCWDILDAGPYNNDGNTPPAYSAYERFFVGWMTPDILYNNGNYSLDDIKSSNRAFIITSTGNSNLIGNDPNPTTFYMLENRQKTGWDKDLPGHGMLITKIQYNYNTWYNNIPNDDPNNMGVDIIEADGNSANKYSNGKAKDAFPAGAVTYQPFAGMSIDDITETSRIINFNFSNSASAVDEVTTSDGTTVKMLKNGMIYIIRNNHRYDLMGRETSK